MKSLAFGLLLISASAMAGDTARIDGRIVTTGMTTAEVLDRVGQPTAREAIQAKMKFGVPPRAPQTAGAKAAVFV